MFNKAKTVNEAIEMATMDAYDEYEQFSGWLACFQEVFKDADLVELNGVIMKFVGFDLASKIVPVVICRLNKKLARVTIDSVQFIDANKSQKLWLRAWKKWSK
jgi:hypothetical protein